MTILETIRSRGSIRRYKETSISKDKLTKILESARLAQSAANRQPWQFIVITEPSIKESLIPASGNQRFVGKAAIVIACLANPKESATVGPFDGFLIDLAIAIENMVLTAWELGIGSCWIGAFNEEEIRKLLDIPDDLRVVSLLTLGYPDQKSQSKYRKSILEIVHYEKFGRKGWYLFSR